MYAGDRECFRIALRQHGAAQDGDGARLRHHAGCGANLAADQINITGTLTINSTSDSDATKFTIYVTSLTPGNTPGSAGGFALNTAYHYIIASATSGIADFSSDRFLVDTSAFFNNTGNTGSFTVSQIGNDLILNYTAVPEPGAWSALLGVVCGMAILSRKRRKEPPAIPVKRPVC